MQFLQNRIRRDEQVRAFQWAYLLERPLFYIFLIIYSRKGAFFIDICLNSACKKRYTFCPGLKKKSGENETGQKVLQAFTQYQF